MIKVLAAIFALFLCFSLQVKGPVFLAHSFDDVDRHLSEYARMNQFHHDNIDDESHSHTHKHSENGDEHEHHHGPKKPTPQETQFFSAYDCLAFLPFGNFCKNGFRETRLFSDSHPDELFRPPIV